MYKIMCINRKKRHKYINLILRLDINGAKVLVDTDKYLYTRVSMIL